MRWPKSLRGCTCHVDVMFGRFWSDDCPRHGDERCMTVEGARTPQEALRRAADQLDFEQEQRGRRFVAETPASEGTEAHGG